MTESLTIILLFFVALLICLSIWENNILRGVLEPMPVKNQKIPFQSFGKLDEVITEIQGATGQLNIRRRLISTSCMKHPTSIPTVAPTSSCIIPNADCNPNNVVCPLNIAPVCGCDNQTYNNACEARFFHCVRMWVDGKCNCSNNF